MSDEKLRDASAPEVSVRDLSGEGIGPWRLFIGAHGVADWPWYATEYGAKQYAEEVARCVRIALCDSTSSADRIAELEQHRQAWRARAYRLREALERVLEAQAMGHRGLLSAVCLDAQAVLDDEQGLDVGEVADG